MRNGCAFVARRPGAQVIAVIVGGEPGDADRECFPPALRVKIAPVTHFCTRSRKWGSFVIGRKTIKKRMRAKLLVIKIELRKKMHDPIAKTGVWMKQMLQGHLNYFAVSGNHPSLWWFLNKVKRLWLASLKRRSQTARLTWERFIRLVARFFPPI